MRIQNHTLFMCAKMLFNLFNYIIFIIDLSTNPHTFFNIPPPPINHNLKKIHKIMLQFLFATVVGLT